MGEQIVIDADFLAISPGEVHGSHVRPFTLQVFGEAIQCLPYLGLGHQIVVEDDVQVAGVERDMIEVGQESGSAKGIFAFEAPHPEQCDRTQAMRSQRISFFLPFGDP
jgi:hypothetical protein